MDSHVIEEIRLVLVPHEIYKLLRILRTVACSDGAGIRRQMRTEAARFADDIETVTGLHFPPPITTTTGRTSDEQHTRP